MDIKKIALATAVGVVAVGAVAGSIVKNIFKS